MEIHKSELLHKGIVSDMGGAASSHCKLLSCAIVSVCGIYREVHEGWYQDVGATSEIEVKI